MEEGDGWARSRARRQAARRGRHRPSVPTLQAHDFHRLARGTNTPNDQHALDENIEVVGILALFKQDCSIREGNRLAATHKVHRVFRTQPRKQRQREDAGLV